jgi:type III secretory pathway lipoprotein EscJ
MPYEDPMEASLRALTDVEWRKRKDVFEARLNKTDTNDTLAVLEELHIAATAEVSAARSGRYIVTIPNSETQHILNAVAATGAKAVPHRRKRNTK